MEAKYTKRMGTSGISGQLYETKLISLFLLRLLNDDSVEEFCIVSNMEGIGRFDDIGIRIKFVDIDKTLLVFLCIKHSVKSQPQDLTEIITQLEISYVNVRRKLQNSSKDKMFRDTDIDETECLFILYSKAKIIEPLKRMLKPYQTIFANKLDRLFDTGNSCSFAFNETDTSCEDHLKHFTRHNEIKKLAKSVILLVNSNKNVMDDTCILRYHTFLAKHVFEVIEETKDEDQTRKWRFRNDFFESDGYIKAFSEELILTYILSRPGPLKPEDAKSYLRTLALELPLTFGNLDIVIRGSGDKIERRLDYLANVILESCEMSVNKIVVFDKHTRSGFLALNGGIGSAIGNLFVYDERTKLLKVTEDISALGRNAKYLFDKLFERLAKKLNEYRFKVIDPTCTFPILSFDSFYANVMLNNLVIYHKQCDLHDLDEIIKSQIIYNLKTTKSKIDIDWLFLSYNNEILKWWMTSENAQYLSKEYNLYQLTKDSIIKEPQMTNLQNTFFQRNEIGNFDFKKSYETTKAVELLDIYSRMIIVTQLIVLTTLKVLHHWNQKSKKEYIVLDIKRIFELSDIHFEQLISEIKSTDKGLIVACNVGDDIQMDKTYHYRLEMFAKATRHKAITTITKDIFVGKVRQYFSDAIELNDGKEGMIVQTKKEYTFTDTYLQELIKNIKVKFQGIEINLDSLVDGESLPFIKGSVLSRIVSGKPIAIGDAGNLTNYTKIKESHIERKIRKNEGPDNDLHEIKTLYDVIDDFILITAAPGMGKSVLLSYLALNTRKEQPTGYWVVNVYLPLFSEQFHKWRKNETVIDTAEALKFICQVTLKNYNINVPFSINITDDKAYISCEGDDMMAFELEIFRQFYNKSRLILLFDAFDEICSYYKTTVINFLDTVKRFPKKNKMWVTSRSYPSVLSDLENVLGWSYTIDDWDVSAQTAYLKAFWQSKISSNLNSQQWSNVRSFLVFMKQQCQVMTYLDDDKFQYVFLDFYVFLLQYSSDRDIDIDTNISETVTLLESLSNNRNDLLLSTPLLLFLVADHLVNIIINKNNCDWSSESNITNVYKMIVKKKLKDILYLDKNSVNIYMPYNKTKYKQAKFECIDKHKRLAAHNYFVKQNLYDVFDLKKIWPFGEGNKDLKFLINTINTGDEKTGLILYSTPDDLTVFIHDNFEEYFFNEYMCDVYRSSNFTIKQKVAYRSAISDNVWMQSKRTIDEQLNMVVQDLDNWSNIRQIWYNKVFSNAQDWSDECRRVFFSLIPDDFVNDCFEKYDHTFFLSLEGLQDGDVNKFNVDNIRKDIIQNLNPILRKYFAHDATWCSLS